MRNSELNLIAISRGSAIGGSAGSSGGATGAHLTVEDSILTINLDWSGAAIGGGGFASGNDSDGGTMDVSNSSVRAYIDRNAIGQWGVSAPGVNNNKAVRADVFVDGRPARLLVLDTSSVSGSSFTVYLSEQEGEQGLAFYSGGLHQYRYVRRESGQGQPSPHQLHHRQLDGILDDPNLYLYVPINGRPPRASPVNGLQKFKAVSGTEASETFTPSPMRGRGGNRRPGRRLLPGGGETKSSTVIEDGKATVTVDSEALSETLESAEPNTPKESSAISADLDGEDVDENDLGAHRRRRFGPGRCQGLPPCRAWSWPV